MQRISNENPTFVVVKFYNSTCIETMNFIKELGTLALGTRIKNLSELLMRDMAKIYNEEDVDFEPRWFTFFQLILTRKEITVTQIAHELNQTHPAAVQVVNMLEKKKLILTVKDKSDSRKKLIKLSKKGNQLAEKLVPLWEDVQTVASEILNETDPDFLDKVNKIEQALKAKSTYQRMQEKINQRLIDEINIIEYYEKYLNDFQQLNKAWLRTYLEISAYDKKVLSDPLNEIIKNSGKIYMLILKGEAIGTYSLRKVNTTHCELLKFTIKEKYRGRKIGQYMLNHALKEAGNLNYKSVLLLTTPKLVEATNLYKKNGFQIIDGYPGIIDKTGRCSIYMKLNI